VVPKVLHKAFDGIFNARFFKQKNVEQNKKRKNVARIKERFFYIYDLCCLYFAVL